jgi:Holliday junction resolvasome RuvABC DNA-binding subunit
LKVLASESIIIENNAIGYTIKYDMDYFIHEYNSTVTVYSGYPLFEEKKDTTAAQIQIWKNAREEMLF